MPEVHQIRSTSKPGLSVVSVEVDEQYFDMEDIWTDLRNRVADVRLPSSAGKPRVNDEFGDVSPYLYALTSDGFSYREMLDYAERLRDEIVAIDGVGKVDIVGAQEERVFLEFSSSEIAAYGYSPRELSDVLARQNGTAPSGDLLVGKERIDLVTLGEFESLEEMANYRLAYAGDSSGLRLDDLGGST